MVKHADKNIAVLKEKAFNKLPGNRRHSTSHWQGWGGGEEHGEAPRLGESRGIESESVFIVFSLGRNGKAVQADLGLASFE